MGSLLVLLGAYAVTLVGVGFVSRVRDPSYSFHQVWNARHENYPKFWNEITGQVIFGVGGAGVAAWFGGAIESNLVSGQPAFSGLDSSGSLLLILVFIIVASVGVFIWRFGHTSEPPNLTAAVADQSETLGQHGAILNELLNRTQPVPRGGSGFTATETSEGNQLGPPTVPTGPAGGDGSVVALPLPTDQDDRNGTQ